MRTRLIAVIGGGKDLSPEQEALAEALGEALVKEGFGVVTGGMGGVMEAASRGAVRGRGKALHPPVVAVLPSYDADKANSYVDIVIPTGMGHARNAIVVAAGDAVVCVGGATGALSEVGLARKIGRPVVAFGESGGTAGLVAKALPSVQEVGTVEEAIAYVKEVTSPS